MSIPSSIYHCFIVKKKTFKVLSSGFVKYSDSAFLLSTITCCTETQQGFLSLPDCILKPMNQPQPFLPCPHSPHPLVVTSKC